MSTATAIRFNQLATIDHFDSKDGVMTVTAIARSPGILAYRNQDGSIRRELVSREFLRRLDSDGVPLVSRLGGAPICNEHPIDGLIRNDADRLNRYKVGESHHKIHVYADGKTQVTFDVFDPETQDDIKFGRKDGISVGYLTNVKHEAGTWHGQHFDAMQDEPFEVDHIAVCKTPRATDARIKAFKFDSAETADIAWQVDSVEVAQESASAEISAQPTGKQPMSYTLTVGNRPIVLDSADAAAAINAMKAENSSLKAKLDAAKKMADGYDDEEDDEDEDDEEGGKKMPPWMKKKMAKKDSAIAELNEHIDSLNEEIKAKDGEISALESIAVEAQTKLDAALESHTDSDAIASGVQERLDAMFEAYTDAKDYLPADFKLDSNSTPESIQLAALSSLGEDFKLDSEDPAAIAGAYQTMKRFATKRQDSSNQLQTVLYQTLPTTAKQDSAPRTIAEYARLDSNDPALASLDFRTLAQVASYRAGRQPINPGAN